MLEYSYNNMICLALTWAKVFRLDKTRLAGDRTIGHFCIFSRELKQLEVTWPTQVALFTNFPRQAHGPWAARVTSQAVSLFKVAQLGLSQARGLATFGTVPVPVGLSLSTTHLALCLVLDHSAKQRCLGTFCLTILRISLRMSYYACLAMVQHQWYHSGIGAPLRTYFSGDWDVP